MGIEREIATKGVGYSRDKGSRERKGRKSSLSELDVLSRNAVDDRVKVNQSKRKKNAHFVETFDSPLSSSS